MTPVQLEGSVGTGKSSVLETVRSYRKTLPSRAQDLRQDFESFTSILCKSVDRGL